jgi:hypothetical protein
LAFGLLPSTSLKSRESQKDAFVFGQTINRVSVNTVRSVTPPSDKKNGEKEEKKTAAAE